jgi:hypothetical protein
VDEWWGIFFYIALSEAAFPHSCVLWSFVTVLFLSQPELLARQSPRLLVPT